MNRFLSEVAWAVLLRATRCWNVNATLGFPGEGPSPESLSPLGSLPGEAWLRLASSVLNGVSSFAGQPWITDGLSSDAIHDVLLGIVLRGNSERPITARVQSQLDSVARLLRVDNLTVIQALYDLGQRLYISDPAPADYSLGDWTVAGGILGDRSFGG